MHNEDKGKEGKGNWVPIREKRKGPGGAVYAAKAAGRPGSGKRGFQGQIRSIVNKALEDARNKKEVPNSEYLFYFKFINIILHFYSKYHNY